MYRTLWFFARYAELPLVLVSVFGAYTELGIWLGVPTGFVVGRLLYLLLKCSFNRLMLGSAWTAANSEMKRLDKQKILTTANGRMMVRTSANGRWLGFALGSVGAAAGTFLEIQFLIWMGALIVGMVIMIGSLSTMPAAFLYLGTSSPDSLLLLRNLKMKVFPLRLVSLLDLGTLQESKDVGVQAQLEGFDNVRVNNSVNWREAVTRLAEVTPIIILDAREVSGPVTEEAKLLQRDSLARKTILVIGHDDRSAAVEEVLSLGRSWTRWTARTLLSNMPKYCRNPKEFMNLQDLRVA